MRREYNVASLLLTTAFAFSGCALVPYNSKFACEGDAEYGKCTNVSGAYREAVTGESAGPKMRKDGKPEDEADEDKESEANTKPVSEQANNADAYLDYKTSVYKKLTQMIDAPSATPMVKQPTQVRTLILNYSTESEIKTLYMPRYVYYFIDDYEFVLTDRLSQPPKNSLDNIYVAE